MNSKGWVTLRDAVARVARRSGDLAVVGESVLSAGAGRCGPVCGREVLRVVDVLVRVVAAVVRGVARVVRVLWAAGSCVSQNRRAQNLSVGVL